MAPFFAPLDPAYTWIALGLIAVDRLVLARVLSPRKYAAIHLPSLILHELTHWVVAAVLGGWPTIKIYLEPHTLPDGSVVGGYTRWGDLWIGDIGRWMACAAPMGWFVVAQFIAGTQLARSQGFFDGIGWLLALLLALGAGLRTSALDLRNVGFITTAMFLNFLLAFVAIALLIVGDKIFDVLVALSCAW